MYKATAKVKSKISVTAAVKKKIQIAVTFKTLAPTGGGIITEYDLIDGGAPNTVYVPINGFELISGGNP